MKRYFANAAYGVLDYASYPLGMFLVAPIVLHKLGAFEFGLWTIATAVVSTGGIIASGFCDANIQRVARLRGTGTVGSMAETVRSMFGINLVIGCTIAIIVALAAPIAAPRITALHSAQVGECVVSLRIASVLILVRAIESVCVSTQRAFEQYSHSVQINTAVRWLTLGSAAALALVGYRTVSILIVTAVFLTAGTYMQFRHARRLLGKVSLWPIFQPDETRALLGFGVFTWIQALGGVIFGQLDRVVLGVALGAAAVAPYTLCVQFSQPIFGVTASGLQFLFPYLSGRVGIITSEALKHTLLKVFLCNVLIVACGAGLICVCGPRLIQAWAGSEVARQAASILPLIVLGSAFTGLSVTGTYAMLALGHFRTLAFLGLSSRVAMLLLMAFLVHQNGIFGLATSRVFYGLSALLLYLPLVRHLETGAANQDHVASIAIAPELKDASNT